MLGKAYSNRKFSYPVITSQLKIIHTLTEIKGIISEKASSVTRTKESQSTQVCMATETFIVHIPLRKIKPFSYQYKSPDKDENHDFNIFLL